MDVSHKLIATYNFYTTLQPIQHCLVSDFNDLTILQTLLQTGRRSRLDTFLNKSRKREAKIHFFLVRLVLLALTSALPL